MPKVIFEDWLKGSNSLLGAKFLRQAILKQFFWVISGVISVPSGHEGNMQNQQNSQSLSETNLPVEDDLWYGHSWQQNAILCGSKLYWLLHSAAQARVVDLVWLLVWM